jgi:hypothetical protein
MNIDTSTRCIKTLPPGFCQAVFYTVAFLAPYLNLKKISTNDKMEIIELQMITGNNPLPTP